jgi:NTP pyrophosphatase (non-canonical NTP hydrolase)
VKGKNQKEIIVQRAARLLGVDEKEIWGRPMMETCGLLVEHAEKQETLLGCRLEMRLNDYCKEAFTTALLKGWHDKPREFGTYIALMHSELSEALEADRRYEGIDRVSEELADVMIRIFDWCGFMGIDLEKVVSEKMDKNKGREYKHGGKAY